MKLNWVTLKVSDLDKSLLFYNGLLGLQIAARLGGPQHQIVMLGEEGEAKVELIFEPGVKIESAGNGISMGLETDSLDALVALLKDKGYKVDGPVAPNPSIRFFFVVDPDGYSVQLIESKMK